MMLAIGPQTHFTNNFPFPALDWAQQEEVRGNSNPFPQSLADVAAFYLDLFIIVDRALIWYIDPNT